MLTLHVFTCTLYAFSAPSCPSESAPSETNIQWRGGLENSKRSAKTNLNSFLIRKQALGLRRWCKKYVFIWNIANGQIQFWLLFCFSIKYFAFQSSIFANYFVVLQQTIRCLSNIPCSWKLFLQMRRLRERFCVRRFAWMSPPLRYKYCSKMIHS